MRQSLHVRPPSVEMLWATMLERLSFVSPGRRMLVMPSSFLPPSIGTMAQNGITHSRFTLRIGVHVRPSSVEKDICIVPLSGWRVPPGPWPAKTNRRVTPRGSVRRCSVGQLRVVFQFSGTGSSSLHVLPPSSLRFIGPHGPP